MAIALFHHLADPDKVLSEADFNEKGLELIRAVHKKEARQHQDLGVGRQKVLSCCAHPGIIKILKKVKERLPEDIYLGLGGFHLIEADKRVVDLINR